MSSRMSWDPAQVDQWMAEWGFLHDPHMAAEGTDRGGCIPVRMRTGRRALLIHDMDAGRLYREVQALLRWQKTQCVPRVLDLPDPHVAVLGGPIDIAVIHEPRAGIWSARAAGHVLRALHDFTASTRRPERIDTTPALPPHLAGLPRDLAHRAEEVIDRLVRREVILHGNLTPRTLRRNGVALAPRWRYGHRAQDIVGYALGTPDVAQALRRVWQGYGARPDRADLAQCGRAVAIALADIRAERAVDTRRERMLEHLAEDLLAQITG